VRAWAKKAFAYIRLFALIGIVVANCIEAVASKKLYKASFAATDVNDQGIWAF
jgi:hypothetical protein